MLAFIDCFINSPVNHCVNNFIESSNVSCTYHMPSKFGLKSLQKAKESSGYIILGSAAHVYENPEWQQPLLDFIVPKLESGIPVLGICYGHQLMAHYFGSEITYIDESKEVLKEARELKIHTKLFNLEQDNFILGYAHAQYVSKLGSELVEIGNSKQFPNEIIKHKSLPFYGTQAHPEASLEFLKEDAKVKSDFERILKDGVNFIKGFHHFTESR